MAFQDTGRASAEQVLATHQIRITLTSCHAKSVEKVCADLIRGTKWGKTLKVKRPAPMPTKTLKITTWNTPYGDGSNTSDHFRVCIPKRLINLHKPPEIVKHITSTYIEPGIEVEVTIADA
ncbi:small ribosomal subunit protein uS10-like [Paroedura picta]|uniref:small ribosomal subunit protein uS10-like n=1 Tax=Paroedura picta TaxID=143630 RepID=UPI0040563831